MALSNSLWHDFSDIGNQLNLTGALSVVVWIHPKATPTTADTGIVNKGALNYALTFHTDKRVYFYIGDGGNHLGALITVGAWHQVAGTFDGTRKAGGMRRYAAGAEVGTRASKFAMTAAAGPLWLGRYGMSYFKGAIEEVGLYDKALSAGAVQNDHCAILALSGMDPLPGGCP